MVVRKTKLEELESVLEIYRQARQFMKESGNPNQWKEGYPSREIVEMDIRNGNSYVCAGDEGLLGTFYFSMENDPAYREIYQGQWLSSESYGVIHRIASLGRQRGVASFCLSWCFGQCKNIRIDTYKDNIIMQSFLRKHGFQYCGIIHLADGAKRLAFQKQDGMPVIRSAKPEDLDSIARIEAVCFPEAEAASRDTLKKRLAAFPGHFYVMEQDRQLMGFINGMVTEQEAITDDMFENTDLHRENGSWQSVFGLDVLPEYQRCGYAGRLMRHLIASSRIEGRAGLILTCKEKLIPFYKSFGYEPKGVSKSVHGGAVWYDMMLRF